MKQFLFGVIVCATTGVTLGHAAERPEAPLDVSAITAVAISGDASSIDITTAPDQPYQATIRRHRTGWLAQWNSGWAYDDCSASSPMSIEGKLLRIDVGRRSWFGVWDCGYDINLNVKKQTSVDIVQQATQADLSGEFSTVTIAAKAADISVSGHADSVSLQGDALRFGLTMKTSAQNEVVSINARMLAADLDFSAAPTLAYAVTAKARCQE